MKQCDDVGGCSDGMCVSICDDVGGLMMEHVCVAMCDAVGGYSDGVEVCSNE